MIIKHFEMRNFGRHKELVFPCSASVVGLLGINGVGKSTVLDGIEFAITGETRDPLPTYVRHGQGNASVDLTFVKNGMEGHIFRQFGSTTKRKLSWDGKTVTAAKEVDATLAKIFGADKKAIANAVFINQGMLDQILFADEDVRKELFIRLVNMSYCARVQNILDGKIKKIEMTIVDLGPAIDASALQVKEAVAAHQAAKAISDALVSYDVEVAHCDELLTAEQLLRQKNSDIAAMELEQRTTAERLAFLLKNWDNSATYEEATAKMDRLNDDLRKADSALADYRSIRAELTHYDRIDPAIKAKLVTLRQLQERELQFNPERLALSEIEARLALLTGPISNQTYRQSLQANLLEAQGAIDTNEAKFKTHVPARESWEQLCIKSQWLADERALLTILDQHLKEQEELAKCDEMKQPRPEGGVQCVKCGLVVANQEALTPEALQGKRDLIARKKLDIHTGQRHYDTLKADFDRAAREVADYTTADKFWKNKLQELTTVIAGIPEQNLAELLQQQAALNNAKNALPDIWKTITQTNNDIAELVKSRDNYPLAKANLARRSEYTEATEKILMLAASSVLTGVNVRRGEFAEMGRVKSRWETLRDQIAKLQTDKTAHEQVLNRVMPPRLAELSQELQGNLVAAKAELAARNDARSQALGRTEQAKTSMERLDASHKDLLRRVEQDAEKRKLIEDLKVLRETMGVDGLPMAVVDYHFRFLAALTQDALHRLDANFSIMMDGSRPLSFKFKRLDEEEHEPLPMMKLSGGQRIRLSTAFLIAVQQRLVKEVGLLVLDEPSTHLNEAGVESLANLLGTLAEQLRHTEMQVIVSDHHHALKNCFQKVLVLT